ncbi:MAG: VCBS repeat-containing protein, partial [Chloroflexi bacterium]|nr:VCBS repeat-containing protein [Chloroflexota bacterium]
GNGDGTFAAPVKYTLGNNPYSLQLAELNGDGKLDVVVANLSDNNLSVLLGNGDGTFQSRTNYASGGSNPYHVLAADVNGDGRVDLVAANYGSSRMGVLLGNGDGAFQAVTSYAAGGNVIATAAADFNHDGRMDLVSANYGSDNITVFLGNNTELLREESVGAGVRIGSGRGNLFNSGDVDYWTFSGRAGDRLLVAAEVPGFPGASSLFFEILRPGGITGTDRLTYFYTSGNGWGQLDPIVLPADGTYSVYVAPNNQFYREYRFKVVLAPPPLALENEDNGAIAGATTISLREDGQSRVGSGLGYIRLNGDLDYYNLGNLTNGSTVYLNSRLLAGSRLSPVVSIYDAANGYVPEKEGSGRPFDGVGEVRITKNGTYFAVVRGTEGTGGLTDFYMLDVQVLPTGSVSFPNLQVTGITVPTGSGILSGQPVSFSFTVQNVGSVATPGANWTDRVVMSLNGVLGDADDVPLGVFAHAGALNPTENYTVNQTVTLPQGVSGTYFLIVQTDFDNAINEFVLEGDNVTVSSDSFRVNRAAYPDLRVEDLVITGPGANNVYTLAWNTANRGDAAATGGFKERVFVKNLTSGVLLLNVERDVAESLGVGATLAQTAAVTATGAGNYQVLITTDSQDRIYEFNAVSHENAEQNSVGGAFQITQLFTVTTQSSPAGGGTFASGSSVTVSAVPDSSVLPYRFRDWTENGAFQSGNSNYTFTLTRNRQLVANFALPSFQVIATNNPPGAGAVTGTGNYAYGSTAVLTANASFGYRFTNWTEEAAIVGTNLSLTNVIYTNRLFTANYIEGHLYHDVTTATLPAGLATVSGVGRYTNGQTAAFTAPATVTQEPLLYTFKRFILNGAAVGTSPTFNKTFSTVDSTNVNLVAEYESRSLRPLIVQTSASINNPVPAANNFVLTFRFDRSMRNAPEALVILTNSAAATQPMVPSGGIWFTTTLSNDTYRTPPITFSQGMDGTNRVLVSQAQDVSGVALALTNAYNVIVDATPPAISAVASVARPSSAVITWQTDEPASSQVELGLTAGYGTLTPLDSQLVTSHRVTVTGLNTETLYHFRVRSRDRAGNEQLSGDATVTTVPAPDLQVTGLVVEPASLLSGVSVTVRWNDANTGSGSTVGSWNDLLVVSNLTTGRKLLERQVAYDAAAEGSIAGGGAKVREHAFSLPDGPEGVGNIFFGVTVDAGNAEFEHNAGNTAENNNTATLQRNSTLSPYPDLLVTSLNAPTGALSGQLVEVSWALTNSGPGAVTKPWTDTVALSLAASGENPQSLGSFPYTNGLASGGSLVRTQTVILPQGLRGQRYFVVTTDSGRNVFEVDEDNNARVSVLPVRLQEADLMVESVSTAPSALQGQAVDVTWVVKNIGDAVAATRWSDRVHFAATPDLSGATVLTNRAVGEASPLAPGASYNGSARVALPLNPSLAAGNFVIVVSADGANQQPESDETNNKASAAIAVTPPPFPDLVVSNIVAPEIGVPGDAVDLIWTVANQGTAAVAGPWSETIHLSGDGVIGQDQLLSTLVFTNGLGVGESLVRTQRVSLPLTAAAGTGRFVVTIDTADNVLELVETNNAALADGVTQVPASLTLRTVAPAIAENAANPVLRATVSRNGATAAALTVNVSNSDLTELEAPATVTIPAGQTSVGFDLRVKQDNVVDGNQEVKVAVSAEGYIADEVTVTVVDSDVHRLGLVIGAESVLEGKTVPATVSRDQANGEELVVRLSSSNPAQFLVPDAVTIPANDLSATVALIAMDDTVVEPATRYGVSATAAGYAGANASVVVDDDDWPQVRVEVPVAALSEGGADQVVMARVVRAVASSRPQVLKLVSSDAEAVWLPTRVTIAPNATAASFTILAVDDDRVNGTRRVSVRVFVLDSGGTRLTEGTGASFDVTDNDGPTLRLALARNLVGEGLRPATTGTVRR